MEKGENTERLPEAGKDMFLKELTENPSIKRARVWGLVVALNPDTFILNDGESQAEIGYGMLKSSDLQLQTPYRIICDQVDVLGEKKLIAFSAHQMVPEDMQRYKEIVLLERRINYDS